MKPFFEVFEGTDILGVGKPFFVFTCDRHRFEYRAEIILLMLNASTRALETKRWACTLPLTRVPAVEDQQAECDFVLELLTDEAHRIIRKLQVDAFETTHNLYLAKECNLSKCNPLVLRKLWCSGIPTREQFDQIGMGSLCPEFDQFMEGIVSFPQAKFTNRPY